jgi:hypothetical protein
MSQAPVAKWKICKLQIQRMLVRFTPVFFSLPSHGVPSVKLRFLENFTLYLRNSWSSNLRAIESCICGLRPIELKMRSILRTVYISRDFYDTLTLSPMAPCAPPPCPTALGLTEPYESSPPPYRLGQISGGPPVKCFCYDIDFGFGS